MWAATTHVKRLTNSQRYELIDYIASPSSRQRIPINRLPSPENRLRNQIVKSLIKRGLVKECHGARETELTDLGREVTAMVLGQYADALARAGALDDLGSVKMTVAERVMRGDRTAPPLTVV